jgi:DNA repair protein RecO (recombination protein O)
LPCKNLAARYAGGVIRIEPALVVALTPHGEHAVVGRFLCADQGLVAAYVHGGRGRNLRAVLQPGNVVALDLAERRTGQLPTATVHALASNMALLHGAAGLAIVDYAAALAAATLPEAVPQPRLFAQFAAIFAAAGAGTDRLTIGAALVRLELALLAELGLGLDLGSCAATGTADDLAFVSPKSRQAVSRAAGAPYAARLLPLPAFLRDGGSADTGALAEGLALSGHFLMRELVAGSPAEARLTAARARMAGLLTA